MHFTPEQMTMLVGLSAGIVVAFGGVLVLAITALKVWLEGLIKNMKRDQDYREAKASEDRVAIRETLAKQNIVLAATHKEVDGLRGINLKTIQDMAQRLSDENPNSARDAATAANAATNYQRHHEAENEVEAMPGTDAEKKGKPES